MLRTAEQLRRASIHAATTRRQRRGLPADTPAAPAAQNRRAAARPGSRSRPVLADSPGSGLRGWTGALLRAARRAAGFRRTPERVPHRATGGWRRGEGDREIGQGGGGGCEDEES